MRIAIAVCNYAPYRAGITNVAERHSAHLATLGHEVEVLCPSHDQPVGLDRIDDIAVRRLRQVVRHGNSALVPTIGAHLRRADALYLHYPFYGGAESAALGALSRGIPYVVFFHMDVLRDGLEGRVLRMYERTAAPFILRRAHRVFVSSLDYAKHSTVGGYRLANLEEFPYAVDTERYRPAAVDAVALNGLGLDPHAPLALFVGAMDGGHAFKGVPQLLEAFARDAGRAGQLALVGDGDLRPDFERLARDRGLVDRARFLGRVPEARLRVLYRAARVTVLPSTTGEEAFGVVLIESMASGTPVIASALPGVRSIVGESGGVLVAPGDVAALGRALRVALDDPTWTEERRARARDWAVDGYSHQRESSHLAEAFESLASASRGGFRNRR